MLRYFVIAVEIIKKHIKKYFRYIDLLLLLR